MIDKSLYESVVAIRRDIHQHPELEFDVERTAKIVAEELRKAGIEVKTNVGKNGVVGDLMIPEATKRIALRADMDALPIHEENEVPYRSKVAGKGHMCGHDSHTAMLIGAARLLASKREKLKNNVRFIFQPCEEKPPGGALGMIEAGCLEGVDAIYALHVWPWLKSGEIGICPGPAMAQADLFEIAITGKGGHAAAPHRTVDPVLAGSHLVTALQSLVSRTTDPLHAAVVSVTQFSAGSTHNVIPDKALLRGTVRTYDQATLKRLREAFESITHHTVKGFGATATLQYCEGYPPVINSERGSASVKEAAERFLDADQIHFPGESAMFGEDFAYYLQKVPGCFIQLGCGNEKSGCIYPLHHSRFNLDEPCMKVGVRLLAELVQEVVIP